MNANDRPALVLSGGGARGAYEVGVLKGVLEVLGASPTDRAPFGIFSGTSVGALNVSYLASRAHRGDLGIGELVSRWEGLDLQRHVRIDPMGFFGWPQRGKVLQALRLKKEVPRRSFLHSEPFERMVREAVAWDHLHDNIQNGLVQALFVSAVRVQTGRTTTFAELTPGLTLQESRDPRRNARLASITTRHVLASAALPFLFPSQALRGQYYLDGGLRFNTPISPAIRVGARRLMVITLLAKPPEQAQEGAQSLPESYPSAAYLAGKMVNALLLDPIVQDLSILERFNALVGAVESALSKDELRRVHEELSAQRGRPYRMLRTLVFRPSRDLGRLASEYVRDHLSRWNVGRLSSWALQRIAHAESKWEADLASYVLFEGEYASRLIELGRKDALCKASEIEAFFSTPEEE